MGIESKDHPSIERKDEQTSLVEIQDITAFAGIDMEELKEKSVANLLAEIKKEGERSEKHWRKKLDIPEDTPLEDGLKQRVEERAREYQEHIEASITRFQEQTDHCLRLAKEKGYIEAERPFSIIVTDPLLKYGSAEPKAMPWERRYDIHTDCIGICYGDPNILLAHEIGHALSADPDTKRSGFTHRLSVRQEGKEEKWEGNKWLNEGTTVIWEEMSANDDSIIPQRGEKFDSYNWSRDAARLLIEELGLNEDTLLKAFFRNQEAISLLERRCQERFHCSIDDLDCLKIELDTDLTKRIISGQPVEMKMNQSRHDAIIDTVKKLQEIFPNVNIIIN